MEDRFGGRLISLMSWQRKDYRANNRKTGLHVGDWPETSKKKHGHARLLSYQKIRSLIRNIYNEQQSYKLD